MTELVYEAGSMPFQVPLTIAVAGAVVCYLADFLAFERGEHGRFAALYLCIGLTTFATVSLSRWIIRPKQITTEILAAVLGILPGIYLPHLWEARIWSSSFNLPDYWSYCVYAAVIATAVNLYFAHRRAREALLQATREAQYESLKSRLQPHFLFNALNGLSELIVQDPPRAERMAEKLAELYQSILKSAEHKTASVETEVAIVKSYLEIESIRFGDRLRFEVVLDPSVGQAHLPSLMAQTLVENAVKHGISPSLEGGRIDLRIERVDSSSCRFVLRNTGAPLSNPRNGGIGLSNTQKRLKLLYGEQSVFSIRRTDDEATEVSFRFSGAASV